MATFKRKINEFLDSRWFMLLVGAIVVLSWSLQSQIVGPMILLLTGGFILLFRRDLKPLLVIVCLSSFSYFFEERPPMPSENAAIKITNTYITTLAVGCGILFVCLVVYLIKRFKADKHFFKPGSLWKGMLCAGIVSLISGIANAAYDHLNMILVAGVGIGVFVFYFLVVNCTEGDIRKFACTLMVLAGFVIIIEMCIYFAGLEDPLKAFMETKLRIGWGMSNSIATLLVMAMPAALYMAVDDRHNWLWLIAAFLFGIGLCVTKSRGNMLIGACIVLVVFVYTAIRTKYRGRFLIATAVIAALLLAGFLLFREPITEFFQNAFQNGLSNNGRFDLWKKAMERFKQNPVFGCGFMGDESGMFVGTLWKVHCTPIQILSSAGIVGFLGFIPFYFQRYRVLLKKCSMFKLFALAVVLAYEFYGLIDLTFFIVYQIFFVFLFLGAAEKETAGMRRPAGRGRTEIPDGQTKIKEEIS